MINKNKNFVFFITLIFLVLIFFEFFSNVIRIGLGIIYPIHTSIKSIEIKNNSVNILSNRRWFIYWIVYSFLSSIEIFTDKLFYWIPFYYAFKLFLIISIVVEKRASEYIYANAIKPIFVDPSLIINFINIIKKFIYSDGLSNYIKTKTGEHNFFIEYIKIHLFTHLPNNFNEKITKIYDTITKN